MIKYLIESYIRRTKNKDFIFDKTIHSSVIANLFFNKLVALIRGLRFITSNKKFNKIFVGKALILHNKTNIKIGNNVTIGDYVTLSGLGNRLLDIGDNVTIGSMSHVIISTSYNNIGSHISIGNNVGFGEFAYLGGGGGLNIGDETIIGQYFSAHPENHVFGNNTLKIRDQGVTRLGINIGKNCWIGSKVTILDGVSVGDNCVIASGAVVNKSYSSNKLIGGVPSKVIKEI
jgi:acetyltransferase-like isoleucine patch superfamily enzyme|tara:strand:- start:651 stop:1343 length:693 start_codon:yes stop_codon:yes gene_type:complete